MDEGQVAVSIVSFNGRRHLQRCLDAVLSQTYRAAEIHLLDNASTDGTVDFVSKYFPMVNVISSKINVGFGEGHNVMIRKTRSPFVLALNQDAFLSPNFLKELVAAMKSHPDVGIAGGKLYSLRTAEFNDGEENIIDMTWLDIEKKRRQVCYAQFSRDEKQCASSRFVFAIDGAAMLLRRKMLEEIQIQQEYFDGDFFAGKEDLDISWRAQLCGWKCLYVPAAIGHHLRTFTSVDRRSQIPDVLRAGSIRNRYLLMIKNDLPKHVLFHFPHILAYDLKILGYVLLRERSSLKGYVQALNLFPKALKKRRIIMNKKKVNDKYILGWFR